MSSQILRNISWLTIANVLVKPIWFLFITYVCIRKLGLSEYGIMTATLAVMAILDGSLTLGSSTYSIREIARETDRADLFLSNFLTFRIAASLLAIILGLGIEVLIGNRALITTAVFAGTYVLARNLTEYCRAIFRAHEGFRLEAISTVGEKLFVVPLGTLFLFITPTAASVLLGMTTGMALTFLVNYSWVVGKYARPTLKLVSLKFFREAMPKAVPLGLASIFVLLYLRTDLVMVEAFKGELAAGQYAMSFRINEALLIIPGMVATVLLPRLSSLHSGDYKRFHYLAQRSTLAMLLVSLLVAALVFVLAPVIINSMERSVDSEPAILLLRIMIWAFPLSAVNYVLSTTLTAGDLQNRLAVILGLAAILNIGLNLSLIPSYAGVGAAYATIITQFVVLVFFLMSPRLILPVAQRTTRS